MIRQTAISGLCAGLLVIGAVINAQAAEKYVVDPGHTQVLFTYNHMGFSNITGSFQKVEGDLSFDAGDWTQSSISVTIPVASVNTGVAKLDEHLKGADFFDAAKFPSVTFKSNKVEKAGDKGLKVSGDLTIHGVTKPAVLDVTVNNVGEHPMLKTPAAGFDASVTIKRSDFGIDKYVPSVSNEVKIHITLEAHKEKAETKTP